MADSINGQENTFGLELPKIDEIIKQSSVIEPGIPTRYHLKPTKDSHDQTKSYRKIIFGERDSKKPHKTILMVGESGIGKTTLINTMINYMLDVQREDKVWFEITDDQSDRTSVHSQTSIITVYGFYLPESKTDLTIIDTPGYINTSGVKHDKEIAMNLYRLCKPAEEIHEIDAVCLVIKATGNRLSDRQIYIFDAVQSLFGRDIAENIVLLFTHSRGVAPKHALTAVKEAKIKCAVNEENQPVFFLFDNCQSEAADEDEDGEEMLKQSWSLSFKGMTAFHSFLNNINPKSLQMTQYVLCQRKQLEENISKMKSHVQTMEQQQNKLKQAHEALETNKDLLKNDKNIEDEVEVPYKDMIDIDPSVAKDLLSCTVCEINCFPESRWFFFHKDNNCTSCKCHHSKHIQGTKYYLTRTRKEKRINEDLKKIYDGKIRDGESLVKKLKEELQELEKEKIKLVMEAFHCVTVLQMISLNTDSLFTLQHIDLLIEKLKEINEPEKVETLENIKKRAGEKKIQDVKIFFKSEDDKVAL